MADDMYVIGGMVFCDCSFINDRPCLLDKQVSHEEGVVLLYKLHVLYEE